MITVNLLGDWHELDTLNGYYCLDDIYNMVGRPKGKSPRSWLPTRRHRIYSVSVTKTKTWASQTAVYSYCAWLDPDFKSAMEDTKTRADALSIGTGVC